MQFDRNKLRSMVLYTISNCDPSRLGAVKLQKVLYYSDMLRYADVGTSISGSTYRKLPFGPTCDQLNEILNALVRSQAIQIRDVEYFGYVKKEYVLGDVRDEDYLSKDEIDQIDEVIDFVCNKNSARSISDFSHGRPWESVDFGEEIRYSSVYQMFPTEVSQEAIDWASSQADEIAYTKSQSDPLGYDDFAAFRSKVLASAGN